MVHGALQMLNDWNEREVKRAETTWGDTFPAYTLDMFNFALSSGKSFLDLGCGFGRFLQFLTDENVEEPDYIGYDSSDSMIKRITSKFPDYLIRCFLKPITDPITHPQEVVICSAVFIHIKLEDQQKILTNILNLKPLPKAITFDINSPSEQEIDNLKIKQSESFERILKTTKDGKSTFRMTWQSHYLMTEKLLKQFTAYNLTTKFYDLHTNRHKVVYLLEKK